MLKKSRTAPPLNPQLLTLTETVLEGALLLGRLHAKAKNTSFADDDLLIIRSREPVPFEQAIDFLKGTVPMHKGEWEQLEKPLRFRAFTVARLAELDHIEKIRQTLVTALEKGEGFQEKWATLRETLNSRGEDIAPGYFETVYRTNVQTAYNAGRLMQYQYNPPRAWELLVIEDGRTSDTCKGIASLIGNGRALPANHPFWKKYGFPPYHFNCRTTFRAVYDNDAAVQNVPLKHLQRAVHIQKGFGGNPLEKESWWKITPAMIQRADAYGITADIVAEAHHLDMQHYTSELLKGYNAIYEGNEGGYVQTAKNADHDESEIKNAKRLADLGHKVYLLPRSNAVKSPDMIIDNELGEIKKCSSYTSVDSQLHKAIHQGSRKVCIEITGDLEDTKIEKTIRHRLERTKNNINEVIVFLGKRTLKL